MADTSYLKEPIGTRFFDKQRKEDFAKVILTDTIGKDIRSFLNGKKFRCLGISSDEEWIPLAAKYFGGIHRPSKNEGLEVYIITPRLSWNEILKLPPFTDDLPVLAIKCEDLSWHLKKEFPDFPVHAIDYSAYMEEKIESIKQAERKAKQLAKGIAQPDFINALPVATLNEDSLLKESFHVVGKISDKGFPFVLEDKPICKQQDVYDAINRKGGQVAVKETDKITCVIYGSDVTVSKFKIFGDSVKYIGIYSFIKWLANARPVDRDCRVFSTLYHSSQDTKLRSYQQSAKDRIFAMWERYRNVLLQMPTGTGKTVLFTSIIKDLSAVSDSRILILAHRKELIDQIDAHLNRYNIPHGLVVNGRKRDLSHPIQVASIQTISHKSNEGLLEEIKPSFIIIDEAHHSLAKTYTTFWKKCEKAWKLGVTATPYRLNNAPFKYHYSDILVSSPIKEFIDNGFLADYEFYTENPYHELTKTIDSIKEKSSTGDYKVKTLLEKLNVDKHIKQLILCYLTYAKGLKGIVYAISIEHAQNICQAYKDIGVEAAFIDSNTPKTERAEIVRRFRDNEIQIMVNVEIFSEGFDCPDIDFIQMARPTWSLSLYLQQVGRGLRKSKGDKKTIILDNSNMFAHFGLPSENWNWIKHFQGYYDIPEIYETIRSANKDFLRSMCHKSCELMFKLTPSQDYQARDAIKKEKESVLASIKNTLGLKKQEVPQPVTEESHINEFESLPYEHSSAVSSGNPTQTNTTSPKKKRSLTAVGENSSSQSMPKVPKGKDKRLELKKQEVPQPVTEESHINEFESLPYEYSSTVSSYNPSQTKTSSPKKKRRYPMVGEDSISQRMSKTPERKITAKSIFIWIIAAVLTIATCILLFSLLGFAVFFLPLLMGAFASKR